jgi:hypothetical protein
MPLGLSTASADAPAASLENADDALDDSGSYLGRNTKSAAATKKKPVVDLSDESSYAPSSNGNDDDDDDSNVPAYLKGLDDDDASEDYSV